MSGYMSEAIVKSEEWFEQNPKELDEINLRFRKMGLGSACFWFGEKVKIKKIENTSALTDDGLKLELTWIDLV